METRSNTSLQPSSETQIDDTFYVEMQTEETDVAPDSAAEREDSEISDAINRLKSNSYLGQTISRQYSIFSPDDSSEKAIEVTFRKMAHRKLLRRLRGTYDNNKPWMSLWVLLTLLVVFGMVAPSFTDGNFEFKIHLREVGFWSTVALMAISMIFYTLTRVVVVIRWSLYWLLLAEAVLYFSKHEYNLFGADVPKELLISLLVIEVLTFSTYILVHWIYPSAVASSQSITARWWWSVKQIRPYTFTYRERFFEPRHTCSYRGEFNTDGLPHGYGHWMDDSFHGEILTGWWENGKPIGPFLSREFGSGFQFCSVRIGYLHCSEDSFTSRSWFPMQTEAVKLGVASVECSVSGGFFSHLPFALSYCGPFNLIKSTKIFDEGEGILNDENNETTVYSYNGNMLQSKTVAYCLSKLRHLSTDHPLKSIMININPRRGVMVAGHRHVDKDGALNCNQLVIDVISGDDQSASPLSVSQHRSISFSSAAQHPLQDDASEVDSPTRTATAATNFLLSPQNNLDIIRSSMVLASETFDGMDDDEVDLNDVAAPPSAAPVESNSHGRSRQLPKSFFYNNDVNRQSTPMRQSFDNIPAPAPAQSYFNVRNWRSTVEGHAEALIFFPGFNASLQHSLTRLGQFMALGKFPPHIKPFVFSFPCGRELTYLWAVDMARSELTKVALFDLLQGIRDAGIREVHLLAHSLGVEALMSSFEQGDGLQPSPLTALFSQVQEQASLNGNAHTTASGNPDATDYNHLLRAKTITLLNPDYSLSKFLDTGFGSLRRICDHITVIGDRKDTALMWSELGNGVCVTARGTDTTEQLPPSDTSHCACLHDTLNDPDTFCFLCCNSACCKRVPYQHGKDRLFSRKLTVGRNIFSLYIESKHSVSSSSSLSSSFDYHRLNGHAPPPVGQPYRGARKASSASAGGHKRRRYVREKRHWLDLDALDTTWMERNVHALRHNYFNLNPVLIEDLTELIVTGKRATERSLLLHREGNIFSYCQAPTCVVND